ncbi:MAG: heavy metal resistance protein [Erythrobacter sp.]|uniref:Spy/CpxP family protein refolding chaperone n=1 Tax=Sphingomonadales TaxID=204457 RepID=UPI000826C1E6|nr:MULTISPECIES: periplasmic heavy metal sensor [Sphingomonadaceae]MBA4046860.1 heavy metal resistance protein [Erythrobacter sp.]MBX9664670.1 periplasmic heavy metal sensor [Novosphingobium sp.]
MNWTTRLILIALVAFAAALGGTYAGRVLFAPERQSETELHALLHSELELDVAQEAKIEAIEQRFATRRKALELEMRAANAHLAEAMEVEHGYGPQVTAAIDHTHKVMGEMQKETLEHLFAMRAVLRPDQAAKFDRSVTRALTPEVR